MKALEKDRERRYETANGLAADVQRHMGNESVEARPPSRLYRFQKAVRRNKLAFAAASAVVVALVIGLSVSTWFFLEERRARNQIRQRQALEQIQVKRLITRSPGWSEETWSLAKEAMRIGGGLNTADIRNQAAATLAGLDAREQYFTNFAALSVLFDQEGKRLLMGGLEGGGKLWDSTTDSVRTPSKAGVGPVAFGADGTPLQLLYESNRHALVLEGVVNSKSTVEWRIPAQIGPATLRKDAPKLAAMTLDGSSILAVFALSDDREILTLFRSNDVRSLDIFAKPLSAVSISSDGELGAAAETDGNVTVWSMSDGRRLATLRTPRTTVLCLAFKRANQVFESRRQGTNELGILATGDSEGNVTIWDVNSGAVRAHYLYGHYGVLAVAFSPDGTMIASGGSGAVDLWDMATERLHLKITCGSPITGLAFAPDGMRLAASSGWSSGPARVSVWALRFGRGIHSLHGLSGQITKVCFSADGRTVAALSQGWKVGVWDTTTGLLLRIIEAPRGEIADNAALVLSPDGRRLVFSAFKTAKMWEIKSGVELASWDLPPGLVDTLGFPDQGHPLLFRVETLDGKLEPFHKVHPTHHPRVCRIRELLSSNLARPVAEIRDFNWHVFNAVAPSDARYFLVHGLHEEAGVKTAMVKAFDGFNGKALWSMPSAITNGWGVFAADPSGRSFIFQTNNSPRSVLARSSSGTVAKTLPWPATAFSSVAGLFAVRGLPSVHGRGYSIFHDTQEAPLVTLGFDEEAASYAQFDLSGNQVAWGNTDGTVTVYNLKEIDGRLGTAELQW